MNKTGKNGERGKSLLRRADQAALAAVLLVSLFTVASWWIYRGGHRGDLIDVERADPQTVEFTVDINRADWPELTELPDIGETLARRIVDARQQGGPFLDHEDVRRRVKGIGPKRLDKMRPYLRPIPPGDAIAGP